MLSTSRFTLSADSDRGLITGAGQLAAAAAFFLLSIVLPGLALASDAGVRPTNGATMPAVSDAAKSSDNANTSESAELGLASSGTDVQLLLEVQINGRSTGKVLEFSIHQGHLMARASDLRDLGLMVPVSRASEAEAMIPLSSLPGVKFVIDQQNELLKITTSDTALLPTELSPNESELDQRNRKIMNGTGIMLNHDLVGTFGERNGVNGLFNTRVFSPLGVLSSGMLTFAGSTPGVIARNNIVRLDTTYSFADVGSLRRYSVGDFVTSSISWARPLRMAGVQIRSDFSMRPDLVTIPLPSIYGTAAVPSTVSVLANDNVVATGKVDGGPFNVQQLPVVSGAGTISMTVTNALGQQVTVTQPFYASSALLAPGLQTFAGQTGLVRRNWGIVSNEYASMAGTAYYRRGLTRKLTLEGSAEGTPGAFAFGAGGVLQVGNLGVVNVAVSPSIASGRFGTQITAGAQRIGRFFSVGTSASFANSNFRDVASMNGAGTVRKQFSAFTSYSVRRWGSLGLAYAQIRQGLPPIADSSLLPLSSQSRILTASYSVQIHHASISITDLKAFDLTGKNANVLQVGLTYSLGRRRNVSVGASTSSGEELHAQQSASEIGDWGYELYGSNGASGHKFAQGQYKSNLGLFTAGVDNTNSMTIGRVESQGALSFIDQKLFVSNAIDDSFAVVDTRPARNVRVFRENREIGSTGGSGRVLVPDLRAFDANHLSIDSTDVPADATLSTDKQVVRPQDRSGVVVKFPIRFSNAALLRIVDDKGVAIPQGSAATLRSTGVVAPVGYDGEAYVEDLGSQNELSVDYPDGRRCTVHFGYHPVPGDLPTLGPLRCEAQP